MPSSVGRTTSDPVTKLRNDAAMIKWNSHKSYLLDLAEHGVAIVTTWLVRTGAIMRNWGPATTSSNPAVSARSGAG